MKLYVGVDDWLRREYMLLMCVLAASDFYGIMLGSRSLKQNQNNEAGKPATALQMAQVQYR